MPSKIGKTNYHKNKEEFGMKQISTIPQVKETARE